MTNHAYFERLLVTLVSYFKAVLNVVDHDIIYNGKQNNYKLLNEDTYTTKAINFETLMARMISSQESSSNSLNSISS